jgi:exopolysaccharide production protein ExoQ
VSVTVHHAPLTGRSRTDPIAMRPSPVERALTVATVFVLVYGTPNRWFVGSIRDLDDPSNPILTLTTIGLIGLGLARVVGAPQMIVAAARREPLLLWLAGLVLASTFWSVDPSLTLRKGLEFFLVTTYALYVVLRYSLKEFAILAGVAGTIGAVLNLAWVLAMPRLGTSPAGWTGILNHKNVLGLYAPWMILLLVTAARSAPRHRVVFYGAALVQAVLLVGSQSRTALVAAVLAAPLLVVFGALRARRTLPGAVLVGFTATSLIASGLVTLNLGRVTAALGKDLSLTGRLPLWDALIPAVAERPILGYGYEAYFDGPTSPALAVWRIVGWTPSHAHNALFEMALGVGLVGVTVLVLLFIRTTIRSVRHLRRVPGMVGLLPLGIVTLSLLQSVSEAGVARSNGMWLFFGIAALSAGRFGSGGEG